MQDERPVPERIRQMHEEYERRVKELEEMMTTAPRHIEMEGRKIERMRLAMAHEPKDWLM